MKLVYIAMPYSHPDKAVIQERMELFYKISATLLMEGKMPISPVLNHPICEKHEVPGNYEFWGDYSRTLLARCDEMVVLMMEGWEDSKGLTDEVVTASNLKIPTMFIRPEE